MHETHSPCWCWERTQTECKGALDFQTRQPPAPGGVPPVPESVSPPKCMVPTPPPALHIGFLHDWGMTRGTYSSPEIPHSLQEPSTPLGQQSPSSGLDWDAGPLTEMHVNHQEVLDNHFLPFKIFCREKSPGPQVYTHTHTKSRNDIVLSVFIPSPSLDSKLHEARPWACLSHH